MKLLKVAFFTGIVFSAGASADSKVYVPQNDIIDNQIETVCSPAYRDEAAKKDFKVGFNVTSGTVYVPFSNEVLKAYRLALKKDPLIQTPPSSSKSNQHECKPSVQQAYYTLYPAKHDEAVTLAVKH